MTPHFLRVDPILFSCLLPVPYKVGSTSTKYLELLLLGLSMKPRAVIVITLHALSLHHHRPHHFRAVLSLLVWLDFPAWFLRLQVLALPYLPGRAVARSVVTPNTPQAGCPPRHSFLLPCLRPLSLGQKWD